MKENQKKKKNIWALIIAILYVLAAGAFGFSIYSMDMLPGTYLAIFIVALLLVSGLLIKGLFSRRSKKLSIVASLLASLLIMAMIAATVMISGTMQFMQGLMSDGAQIHQYHVVVREDSELKKLDELAGKTVYVQSLEDDKLKTAKENLQQEVQVKFKGKDTINDLADALIEKDAEVIFLNAVYYDMAVEDYDGFTAENTRIIDTINVIIETEHQEGQKDLTAEPFNIYVSGIDATGSISNVARSDVNMVLTVNPVTKEILLTSIPRDYYVELASYGAMDKLTHSGIYGIDETVSTVENLLDIEISHYVKVNFTTVTTLVDALGGITVDSELEFVSRDGYYYAAGPNELNGEQALSFARERKAFSAGDNQRVKNQQAVITGIINKMMGSTAILTQYSDILAAMADNVELNFSMKEITSLVKMQLADMSSWSIEKCSLRGSGDTLTTYTAPGSYAYVMIPDETSVAEAKTAIDATMGILPEEPADGDAAVEE